MIKAVIVDDESHVREDIRDKIRTYFDTQIEIVAEAESVASGISIIQRFKPNLLFLDIHLSDGTGFDLVTKSVYKDFDVIFVTGYNGHAIKAIKAGALDYILKPVDDIEFEEAVIKAIQRNHNKNLLGDLIEVSNGHYNNLKKKRIILKTSDAVHAVYEDDIIYCKSDGNYTTFHTKNVGKITISKPILKMEDLLTTDIFIRCHQSYIVNKNYVLKYNKQGNLITYGNTKIPVSTRRKEHALKSIF